MTLVRVRNCWEKKGTIFAAKRRILPGEEASVVPTDSIRNQIEGGYLELVVPVEAAPEVPKVVEEPEPAPEAAPEAAPVLTVEEVPVEVAEPEAEKPAVEAAPPVVEVIEEIAPAKETPAEVPQKKKGRRRKKVS